MPSGRTVRFASVGGPIIAQDELRGHRISAPTPPGCREEQGCSYSKPSSSLWILPAENGDALLPTRVPSFLINQ